MTTGYWNQNSDPYRYPGSETLRNLHGLKDAVALERLEQRLTALRLGEVILSIRNPPVNLQMWQTIHRILFQDIYSWAGEIRTVQLAKGGTVFAMPEHIALEGKRIFADLNSEMNKVENHSLFANKLAFFFGELNVLHPFREGNGRTQKLLFDEIARRFGYGIDWQKIEPKALLQGAIEAFHKQQYSRLEKLFHLALI